MKSMRRAPATSAPKFSTMWWIDRFARLYAPGRRREFCHLAGALSLSIAIETPNEGRAGCSRMAVSPAAVRARLALLIEDDDVAGCGWRYIGGQMALVGGRMALAGVGCSPAFSPIAL